ncbi:hypothetical protein ACFO0N_01305 [Halobium salinum]|uniref:DUF5658 domain-containing protein n=1 Tax=Halobium salinum TaxID=1364940 RepID=A0ABD5P6U8_9EURY|nr:hypothetical protein [Halobium salinum]
MNLPAWLSLRDTPYEEGEFTTLWTFALATYGVGDMVTTIALMEFVPRLTEGNPLVAAAVGAFGQSGLVGLKLAAFLFCLVVSLLAAQDGDRLLYYGPPAGLAVTGAFTTVYNLRLLFG